MDRFIRNLQRSPDRRASIDPTQPLEPTQPAARCTSGHGFDRTASADLAEDMEASGISRGIDTQLLKEELMKITPTPASLELGSSHNYDILG